MPINEILRGMLKSDAMVGHGGEVFVVLDAKCKRLTPTKWNQAPPREDRGFMGAFEALTISSHRLYRWYLTQKCRIKRYT